jgi:predicted aspartyl protease
VRKKALLLEKRSTKFCLALLALLTPGTARAECRMAKIAELPITLWQDKLFIPILINGTPESFFIDTGAAITTISEATANALEIPHDFDHTSDMFGIGGQESHLYLGELKTLALGAITLDNPEFPIARFGQLMADGTTPWGGLIGADILSHFDVDIDIPHRRIALWRVAGCASIKPDWPGEAQATPIDIAASHHVTVPVKIDHVAMDLLLDTGSPSLVLSTRSAARAGATPDILEESRQFEETGANDRAVHAWFHIFQRMEVAGHIFGDVRTVIVQNGRFAAMDGLLGLDYLKQTRLWLSYSTSTLFLQPQARPRDQ